MKEETAGVAIKGFVGLTPKMCSYLVDDNSKHKKAKGINKNIVMSISHNEYKDVFFFLNNKCLRHVMNRNQSKNHKKLMKSTRFSRYSSEVFQGQ